MDSQNTSENKPVGVIGAGKFGTAIANILAENRDVILFSRRPEVVDIIEKTRENSGQTVHERVKPTSDLKYLSENCRLIFPIVASANFREMIQMLAPHLEPEHILIHGTKGLDVKLPEGKTLDGLTRINRGNISTMSEIILQETVVKRVGCLAGPNLAPELAAMQPAATVVASKFDEVRQEGINALRSSRFQVYENHDITGVELAGVLKNIIALASGALRGLGYGENARALLISRGMVEMIYIGRMLGGDVRAFFGLAGIGDLIATCASDKSRNYTVGYRLAKGETLEEILGSMEEVAEGVNTVKVIYAFVRGAGFRSPLTETVYNCVHKDMTVKEGVEYLMNLPFNVDVDYL